MLRLPILSRLTSFFNKLGWCSIFATLKITYVFTVCYQVDAVCCQVPAHILLMDLSSSENGLDLKRLAEGCRYVLIYELETSSAIHYL